MEKGTMKIVVHALLLVAGLIASVSSAQEYPSKVVTIIVPFPAGGSNDTIARHLADSLGKLWKQPVIIDNRPGAGSSIGSVYVARSSPDGYKMVLVSSSYTTNAATRTNQGFDPLKDLKPVSMVARGHNVVVTGARVPMATLADLVREAKAQTIFYGTAGVGSAQHFNAELLTDALGIQMSAVPYKGGQEALADLVGGRIDVIVGALGGLVSAIQSGKGKAIAVLSKARSPLLPNVPTTAEAGYPAAVIDNYWAIFVPAGTPNAIVAKLNRDIKTVTHTFEGREFLRKVDAEPTELNPEEVAGHVTNEIATWTKLAKKLNISAN